MGRSIARSAYPLVAGLFVACAVIQVFLAGLGVFDDPNAFVTHRNFGYLFGWLTLVLLVIALVGRLPRRYVALAVLILVLFALQSVFVALREDMPAVAALHPLNGFLILGTATYTAWTSLKARSEAAASEQHAATVPTATTADA
ncbi:MAG TPA: COX15/CtaA family protein [Candidatus Limnocylindrales bacterium]|nr:COX15/CtaA family protein [Candidatus Limnocylindrales bacterium]